MSAPGEQQFAASATVRAAALTAELAAVRERARLAAAAVETQDEVVRWLREVGAAQQTEIERLREEVRRLHVERRGVAPDTLVRSLMAALEVGDAALPGHAITAARAELRAVLVVADGRARLAFGDPQQLPGDSTSTVTVEFRALPPDPYAEDLARTAAAVVAAALELQAALDRDFPPEAADAAAAALARASELAAAGPHPQRLAELLPAVAESVGALAERLPAIAPAAGMLAERVGALPAAPGSDALAAVAEGLRAVAAALAEEKR